MDDLREKVIKGLECCSNGICYAGKCPYENGDNESIECIKKLAEDALSLLKAQEQKTVRFGKWKQIPAGMTPGGTPMYACGNCGGSDHLHGTEYPQRKVICDCCGQINIYPWEKAYEEGSSLWPTDAQREEAEWE